MVEYEPGEELLERYRVRACIRRGVRARVYLADDLKAERQVRVRVLDPRGARAIIDRLGQEARVLARLRHTNLARVLAFGIIEGTWPCVVTEDIDGVRLADRIGEAGPAPWQDAVTVVTGSLGGVAAMHEAGILHRHLAPHNILLMRGKRTVKLVDLGYPAPPSVVGEDVPEASLVAALRFLSPEQILGRDVDPRVDVYAAGCVLYYALTGRLPFADNSLDGMLEAKARAASLAPPLAPPGRPEIPREIRDVVMGAVSHDPEERPANASQLARELHRARTMALGGSQRQTDRFNVPEGRARSGRRAAVMPTIPRSSVVPEPGGED